MFIKRNYKVIAVLSTIALLGLLLPLQTTILAAPPLPVCLGVTYDSTNPNHILGTNGDDTLVGTAASEVFFGLNGNDNIQGGGGNDIVCGDNGDDTILTLPTGNDTIDGGNGNDLINGGAGNDTIFGGNGDDDLRGAPGNDTLFGGNGNDAVKGGAGNNDQCDGGRGTDTSNNTCEITVSIP